MYKIKSNKVYDLFRYIMISKDLKGLIPPSLFTPNCSSPVSVDICLYTVASHLIIQHFIAPIIARAVLPKPLQLFLTILTQGQCKTDSTSASAGRLVMLSQPEAAAILGGALHLWLNHQMQAVQLSRALIPATCHTSTLNIPAKTRIHSNVIV